MELLFDPMFRLPFVVGLVLAAMLPLLGLYLRLRGEWLAALGYAHMAGAGAVLAPLLGVAVLLGAFAAAVLAALGKGLLRHRGNEAYAFLILLGWSMMLLGAVHSHHGQLLGQALIDGQLYFIGQPHLLLAGVLAFALLLALPRLSAYLLREHLFPWHDRANRRPVWLVTGAFDVLVALAIALAATAMGVMAAFAVIFVPAWIAYALAKSWRGALLLSALLGALAYIAAFVAAIGFDLPFGPTFVVSLLALVPLRLVKTQAYVA